MEQAAFSRYQAEIQRAEEDYARADYAAALQRYLGLLRQRLATTLAGGAALDNAGDILVAERLAQLALLFGHAEAADALLDGIAEVAGQAGNTYLQDYTVLQQAHLALAAGRPGRAQQLLRRMASIGRLDRLDASPYGLAVWEAQYGWADMAVPARTVLRGNFYLVCGQLFLAEGVYGAALACCSRGAEVCGAAAAPDLARRLVPRLQLAQAAARVERGDLSDARSLLQGAGMAADAKRQPASHVQRLELLGKLHLLAGEYGAAVRVLNEVLALVVGGGFHAAEVAATINLAHVLTVLNQTAEARALLEGARATAMQRNDELGAQRIAVVLNLGVARGQSQAAEMAIAPSVNEILLGQLEPRATASDAGADPELLPQEGSFLAFCETRALAVHWHLGQFRLEAARAALLHMVQIFGPSDSPLIALRLAVLEAMLDHYAGAWRSATEKLKAARQRAESLGLHGELWQILRHLAGALARQGLPAADVAADADRLLQQQAASLEGPQRALFLLNKWKADEERLVESVHALQLLKREADAAAWPRRLALRWRLHGGLKRLAWQIDRHKALASPGAVAAAPAARLWQGLGRRQATLAFLVLPDRTVIMRRCGWSRDFAVRAITRLRLHEIVTEWHRTKGAGQTLEQALALDEVLATLPPQTTALRIIPDDILHGVPFAALRHQQKYWAERYALSVGFEAEPRQRQAGAAAQALLLAGVSRGCGQYAPLRGVPGELAEIGAMLAPQQAPLLDGDATRAELLRQLPRSALIHIACHGEFQPDQPDQSGLVLVPSPGTMEMLTLRDLAGLDLRAAQHATLSSCWGADSFIVPGRWLVSLPETLLRAGCGSVLASLWWVADADAQAFMSAFYRHARTQRRDRALQLSQQEFLARTEGSAPWTWFGFVLYGEAGPLPLPTKGVVA